MFTAERYSMSYFNFVDIYIAKVERSIVNENYSNQKQKPRHIPYI